MADNSHNLAEQALDNLVNQFARPLDFLRELVQNSIDAGSPRIEVRIDYEHPKEGESTGVTIISVEDWGEGMDETIIDGQLTRLFSSAKEGDLTKIGKFGIGFTSIFAIKPELIQLRTGRHGENWELLFQADRSYLKNSIDEPIDGTKIKLFKRMPFDEVEKFVEESRFILTYWCEHSNVPITFWDRTLGVVVEEVDDADPFAAFASVESAPEASSGPEQVNRPLDASGAELWVHLQEGDVEAVVGVGIQPLYGYYNGGLTLLRTRNVNVLQKYEPQMRHLVFKVKNDALEHTLTRDSVLDDENWHAAMKVVLSGRTQLIERLVERVVRAVADPDEDETVWQSHLARLCAEEDVYRIVRKHSDKALFLSCLGEPLTLQQVERQQGSLQVVLVWDHADALARGVLDAGYHIVKDSPAVRDLIDIVHDTGLFQVTRGPTVVRVDEMYVLPQTLDLQLVDDQERKLLLNTAELLQKSVGKRLRSVRLGDFGGPIAGASEALLLNGASEGGVYMRKPVGYAATLAMLFQWAPAILRLRHMLVNRHHPLFRAQLLASSENPWLAAAGLASALLHEEGIEPERIHEILLILAHTRLEMS